MRWLVLLALVACGGKEAEIPALDSIDRSCAADSDCTLTGHLGCCDTSCGRDFGVAVNARAWGKVSSRMRGDCSKEECHVMCQKQPECREDGVPVCRAGTCELVMKKTAACESSP